MSDHIVSLLQLGQFSCGTRPSKMKEKLQRMNSTWDEQRLGLTMLWATFSVKNRWKCDQHLNVIIIKGEWGSVKKMVIHRIYTETPNMRVIVSVPWHCQNVDPSTCQCAKSYIVDCEGVFGQKNILILLHPPYSPDLAPSDFLVVLENENSSERTPFQCCWKDLVSCDEDFEQLESLLSAPENFF